MSASASAAASLAARLRPRGRWMPAPHVLPTRRVAFPVCRSFSAASEAGGSAEDRPHGGMAADSTRRLRFHALDGSSASLEAALRVVGEIRPQQLMLETCSQRRVLVERRAAAATAAANAAMGASAATSSGSGATVAAATVSGAGAPLSHADAISVVHGGISGTDVTSLLVAAENVGAQAYMIDRPYQETQNRVARVLVLRPAELLAFARLSAQMLSSKGLRDQSGAEVMRKQCPGVHEVLVTERERFMAAEIDRRAVPGAEVFVCCTPDRLAGLKAFVDAGGVGTAAPDASSAQASRIWPFLLILIYAIIPTYGSILIAWRVSRWLADRLTTATSADIPLLLPPGERPAPAQPAVQPGASEAEASVAEPAAS